MKDFYKVFEGKCKLVLYQLVTIRHQYSMPIPTLAS